MPENYDKPLPAPQPESDHYWQSAAAGKLVFQRCRDCGEAQFYPRVLCVHCSGRSLEWEESAGKGTLFTYTIVHIAPHPGFREDVPYVAGIVELEEGLKMPASITGVEPVPESIAIGMPLEVVFDQVTDEITLPRFRPA